MPGLRRHDSLLVTERPDALVLLFGRLIEAVQAIYQALPAAVQAEVDAQAMARIEQARQRLLQIRADED
jgi:hypothetical protein